jgi:hypothetical protein
MDAACADVDAKVAQHLHEVRERLRQLRALERELQRLNVSCEGGGAIKDCLIIEALSEKRASERRHEAIVR